jgi:ribose transport system ATP-binding protein
MSDTVLSIKAVSKAYPGVQALDVVSVDFRRGEVHALLGENGAGKSTLIKIIAGAIEPDSGSVAIAPPDSAGSGAMREYERLNPHLAMGLGIAVIYQEFNLVGSLSAAENIKLGKGNSGLVDRRAMNAEAAAIFSRFGVDIDPEIPVRELSSSQQQIVEIAKAVAREARILVMDEPTAPLSVAEVEKLFTIIRDCRARGVCVVYISHRIDELFAISDRVTVLRDGRKVETRDTASATRHDLIGLMVGRELSESWPSRPAPREEPALELRGVSGNGDQEISFILRKGEILGLAGLVGAGRTELARVIYGAARLDAGGVLVGGRPVRIRSPAQALKAGIGLIPENRKEEGCHLNMTIAWNIALPSLRAISRAGLVRRSAERELATRFGESLRIRAPSLAQRVGNLSGGNQQKVVLAKMLGARPDVLIFDEPTRGIDVGSRQEIYRLMGELAAEGHAILMITSDMEELLGMSDRIAVLSGGRLAGLLGKSEFSQRRVLELASGSIDGGHPR